MKRISVLIALFVSLSSILTAADLNVCSLGAFPNDGKDDTKALRKAAAYCRANPGTRLIMPAGVYNFKDTDAVKLENDVLAGKYTQNPEQKIFTPYFQYTRGLDFSNSKDITIEAFGAVLMCEGWMEPFAIYKSENFILKGITIDYKRKPFVTGVITEVTPDFFEIQFTQEKIITDSMPLTRMTFWNTQSNRIDSQLFYFPKRTIIKNNKVRFSGRIAENLKGEIANVNNSFHFCPAIMILKSTNVTLEGVTIHSQAGMGIVGFDSKDILLKGVSVKPANGYTQSTNTDATHFACCEGLLRFEGCYFQGQGDDATNVHGYYQTITAYDGKTATIEVKAGTYTHAQIADVPRIGDKMELVDKNTLTPVKVLEVTAVQHTEKQIDCNIQLSEALPKDYSNYYLMNITKLPRLEFENSVINSHLARGILVKTRNVVINKNIFRGCTGTAIHIGAEAWWHEGTHAKNVVITDNMISGCGNSSGSQGGASGIAVIIEAKNTATSVLHDNIRIEGNMIIGENNDCGIYVSNAQNVIIKKNKVTNCKTDILTNVTKNVRIDQ